MPLSDVQQTRAEQVLELLFDKVDERLQGAKDEAGLL